jgi:hypothetical protein
MSPNQPSPIRLSHYKCLVYACHDIMVGSARIVLLIIEKEGKFSLWKKRFFAVAVCWRRILGRNSGAGFHDGSARKRRRRSAAIQVTTIIAGVASIVVAAQLPRDISP